MVISQTSVFWKLLIFPCDLLVLFHSSRWYLTGSFLRFSNSNELSCKKRKNMVLREIEKKHVLKLFLLFTEVLSISSYCCCSVAQSCPTLRPLQHVSLSFTISRRLLKLMSIESVIPSSYLILYPPLLLLPSVFPSISEWVKLLSHVWLFATSWTVAYLPGSSLCGILQARVLEWVAICLFKWVSSLHQVAKVLEFQLQCQSFPWIFRTDFL